LERLRDKKKPQKISNPDFVQFIPFWDLLSFYFNGHLEALGALPEHGLERGSEQLHAIQLRGVGLLQSLY